MGKCPDCGTWDALEETTVDGNASKDPHKALTWAWQQANEAESGGSIAAGGAALLAESADEASFLGAHPLDQSSVP